MTTGDWSVGRYDLVLEMIPTGVETVCTKIWACDDHDFELDKHFLVVEFWSVAPLFKAEPSSSNPSHADHPSCKT